ncbi:hypothetical protein [Actinoplanes sp. NPDC051411]|uniref:hypothetical protein n=1 Tax=Actinoplanes sp. NPDC051411 TaxID=3155522 RepID=UPI00341F670C
MTEKLRLSATPSIAARVIGTVAGLIFVVVGIAFAALPLIADGWLRDLTGDNSASCDGLQGIPSSALPPELRDCANLPSATLPHPGLGPIRFVGLIGLPFALLGLYLIVRVLRTAAWLDGPTLHLRYALTTRSANLSTADVSIDQITRRTTDDGRPVIRQVPTLAAKDVDAPAPIRLPLLLPATELRALADAIATGRAPEGRDRDARRTANQLRAAADNPLAHRL